MRKRNICRFRENATFRSVPELIAKNAWESKVGQASRIFRVIRFSHVFSCRVAYTWKFGRTLCGWKSLGRHLHARISSRLVTLPYVCLWQYAFFFFGSRHCDFIVEKNICQSDKRCQWIIGKIFWNVNYCF